ncbi:TonB-dependent receptor domain-containing protein [uncultured Hyphomonas sp.]|uniref:TonB-dependent receptor domain-containing protein n=1 Tax=uncultured Hyphomonas sp. TaxID=225298 RepID=UPI002AAB1C53|nr:TonB-dependent receptor [uncultured Hyphomonas sp.]
MMSAHSAFAQEAPAAEDAEQVQETVVVSGSRVITNGYQAPTPVTITTAEDLKAAEPNLTEALRQLPQLSGSSSPSSVNPTTGPGPSTNSTANLRDLGPERTLILLDGRRAPPSLVSGTSDMSFFPMALVKRVEVVTGGASAAYGSGAVSGVVNFVLDTDFEGFSGEIRGGVSDQNDAGLYGLELAGGTKFANDRGSFIFSVDVRGQDGLDGTERGFSLKHSNTISNPLAGQPGQPTHFVRDNVTSSFATFNGLIRTPGPLFNTNFDDAGNPIAYTPGTEISGAGQVGGDGAIYEESLLGDSQFANMFAHIEYQLTDSVDVYAEGSYGVSEVGYPLLYPFNIGGRAYAIQQDNAFLPEAVRDVMVANDIDTVSLWKIDRDIGRSQVENKANTLNFVAGLNAELPKGYSLEAYYEHGESLVRYAASENLRFPESRLAADAVVNPDNGQIVCRSTLTDPTNGCVPINVFGYNPLSDAQQDYLIGQSWARSKAKQDVVAATISGDPVSTWAGPVSVAVGAEYRKLSNEIRTDETSQRVGWSAANYFPSSGEYDVYEGFAETLVPLLVDQPLAKELSLNAAVRYTNYSTSGGVTSWKVGLTDEVVDGLLLRTTYSRDIRAPHIGELFGGVSRGISSVTDPENGGQLVQNIITFSGSNSDLEPELSDTFTAGFSYQPPQIPGLGLSVDYYKLDIESAIAALSTQTIVDQCSLGNQELCSLITRDSSNQIVELRANVQNADSAEVAGVDFEANYSTSIFGGELSVRGIATYLDTFVFESPGAPAFEQAGYVYRPHWRGNLFATFEKGPMAVTLSERYLGESYRLAQPNLADDAKTGPAYYTNLSLRYDLGSKAGMQKEFFANISNLFNQEPQVIGSNSAALSYNRWSGVGYYDGVGRYYTIGLRIRY